MDKRNYFSVRKASLGGCRYALEVTWGGGEGGKLCHSQLAGLQMTDDEYEPNRGNRMKIWIVLQGMLEIALGSGSKT